MMYAEGQIRTLNRYEHTPNEGIFDKDPDGGAQRVMGGIGGWTFLRAIDCMFECGPASPNGIPVKQRRLKKEICVGQRISHDGWNGSVLSLHIAMERKVYETIGPYTIFTKDVSVQIKVLPARRASQFLADD
uniref:Uncharacterized protein n=1 Tax=Oryza sativa subsp. japonica TaxID=39947 RepID=Q10HG5_ORYSJ|nr:hypothetical protein LOC_Os03g39224 [Oryza sativa Japonica Group]